MNLGQVLEDVEVVIRKEKIVKLNDWLRKEGKGGQIICTAGVFSSGNYNKIIEEVRNFDKFNEDNDPYKEHDFGKVSVDGTDYFWKIDYYDKRHSGLSEDPADQTKTRRVMTIMKAEEY